MHKLNRPLNEIHFGILPTWKEDSHYASLKGLLPGPAVYLGIVYPNDKEGAQQRLDSARQHLKVFGVAPQCGLVRTSPEGVDSVLKIVTKLSAMSWAWEP
jgi:hypothetical protein